MLASEKCASNWLTALPLNGDLKDTRLNIKNDSNFLYERTFILAKKAMKSPQTTSINKEFLLSL